MLIGEQQAWLALEINSMVAVAQVRTHASSGRPPKIMTFSFTCPAAVSLVLDACVLEAVGGQGAVTSAKDLLLLV